VKVKVLPSFAPPKQAESFPPSVKKGKDPNKRVLMEE
jgi:hypothetical protein